MEKKPSIFYKIFNGFSDSTSFKRRLFMSFLLIAIPIITGVCVIAFLIIRESSREIILQTQATELEKTSAQLEAVFNGTENMSRELISNSVVQDYMTEASDTVTYPEDTAVSNYINGLIVNRDYIDSVVLITTDRTVFSTENAYSDRSSFQTISEKWWYFSMADPNTAYAWYPYSRLSQADYESQEKHEIPTQINTLMLARAIYSMNDYRTVLGYLMVYLDDEYMEQLWQDISWGSTTNVFLCDENGAIIAANSRMNDYTDVLNSCEDKTQSQLVRYEGQLYTFSSTDMTINDWQLYMITPYGEVNSSTRTMMAILFSVMGAIVLALFFMSKYSANNMARPVVSLSKLMDSYHGSDQQPDPEVLSVYQNRSDEIGQMYRSYEQLADRMNRLIQEIYVKNLEKKDAELALLQSQINPHFLYNTLDSINWIALANDQDEISEMITALSDTFRLSLMKNNSSFVEMEQEIQYIKSYLVLQKFRYAERLSYALDVPADLPKLYIPRFILQPVVENGLKHGIDRRENGGKILIRVEIGKNLSISVINDGIFIDLEKMKGLLVFNPDDSDILNFKKDGYGVQNIHRRIKIICGDDYGLSYSIRQGQTVCLITLPIKTEL